MPTFFQRPENALKRAKEFIKVRKRQRALDALCDVIKSKKHRTWQKIHEPIMELYLELCVELKCSHTAKEGLYQYKNICQQVNIKSLEDVVRKYLSMADQKTEAAKKKSHQRVVDIDDLDVIQTPENILLSAVSGEDTQDRTDRAILTPWVKFLWESYRQCLDLLRNNSSVEKLYQDIAQQAFQFCLTYERKTEFRKLCDNLRTHLGHIYKHQHQQRAINLNNPESQAMHLDTRLVQLDSAIQMDLWQEAFKAVEDIHGLITLSKKTPKPALMANYYNKLGLVFWKSGNHMFHACAWHRLFHLSSEQRKNLGGEELAKLASRVLCATLAIPIPPSHSKIDQMLGQDETTMEKQRRLSTLLGLANPPDRATLVKDLVKYNIINHVYPELQNLHKWVELEFHPLKLASRVQGSLEFLDTKDDLKQYVPALQDITVTRLLKQVSQVYQTIEFSRLAALAPFVSQFHIERIVVNAAKNLDLQVRIDHRNRMLSFGTDLGVAQKEDCPEGPYLQSMPSEQIRNQLAHMAYALEKCVKTIKPREITMKNEELKAQIINSYRMTARKDHIRILQRRQIIEERKEELENLNTMREREEMEQLEEQRRRQMEAEQARLQREADERERQRREAERREIQLKAAKEKLDQLRQTTIGAKVFNDMDEELLADMDTDEIMQKQVEQLEKEKKEMQEKLRTQEKKIDYFERAKRHEEMALLQQQYDEEKVRNKDFWQQQEAERIKLLKIEREDALKHRDRLSIMREEKDAFLSKLKEARMSVYKEKVTEFDKRLIEERKRRLAERKEKRKEERKAKFYREKEEEAQRKRDEELKRQREEEERLAEEQRKKEEEEYAERLRKLEEQAERQRQREREIEEREQKRREEAAAKRAEERGGSDRGRDRDDSGPWRRGGGGGGGTDSRDSQGDQVGKWRPTPQEGGWRARERERKDSWRKRSDGDDDAPPPDRDRSDHREASPREPPSRWREDRPSPREDRWGRDRDDRPPIRDRDDRPPMRDRDDRPPMRDRDGPPPREDRGGWRDRGPPRDDDRGSWRDRERDRDREPPMEDRWRDSPRGGDRDRMGGGSWRGDRGRDDRDGPWRDDRGPPPRDRDGGGWRGDRDRDRDRDRDDAWGRRGGDRRDDRGGRDDDAWGRGGGRRDDRGPRDRDDRGPRDRDDRDRGSWRRDVPPRDERDERFRGMPRDIRLDEKEAERWKRGPDRGGDRPSDRDGPSRGTPPARTSGGGAAEGPWRRGGESRSPTKEITRKPPPPEEKRRPAPSGGGAGGEEDDGWTTVRR